MNSKKKQPDFMLKMGAVAIGIIVLFVIVIGTWLWDLVLDPNNVDWRKLASKAVLNGSLSVVAMVLLFVGSNESLKAKESGKYQERYNLLSGLVEELFNNGMIVYFDQYLEWNTARQLKKKQTDYLVSHGIPRLEASIIIDYADVDDIPTISGLKHGDKPSGKKGKSIDRVLPNGDVVPIPAIKDTCAYYVEMVLSGQIKVSVEDSSYYTTADKNRDANLTSLERPQATEKERVGSMRNSFLSKVVVGLVYSFVAAMFVIDQNAEAGTGEAIWNLIWRIVAITMGSVSGSFVGSTNVRYLTKQLGEKAKVLEEYKKFTEKGEFVPKTYKELVQERRQVIEEIKKKGETTCLQLIKT